MLISFIIAYCVMLVAIIVIPVVGCCSICWKLLYKYENFIIGTALCGLYLSVGWLVWGVFNIAIYWTQYYLELSSLI